MLALSSFLQPVNSFCVSYYELKTLLKTEGKTDEKVKAAALKVFVTGFHLVTSTSTLATMIAVTMYVPYGFAITAILALSILHKNKTLYSAIGGSSSTLCLAHYFATQITVLPPVNFAISVLIIGIFNLNFGKSYNEGLEDQMSVLTKNGVSNACFYDHKLQRDLENKEKDAYYDLSFSRKFTSEDRKLKRANEEGYWMSKFYSANTVDRIINFAA